jgi:hypothetical protein
MSGRKRKYAILWRAPKALQWKVSFNLGHCLWPRLMVFAVAPDDAMALSIDLQKAAIDAATMRVLPRRCSN